MNRTGRVALGVAALLIGVGAVYTTPESRDLTRPIERHGAIGQSVSTRVNAVRVVDVTAAHELRMVDGTRVRSPGEWIVATVQVTPRLSIELLRNSTIRTGGVEYGAWDDPGSDDLSAFAPDPGIPVQGTLAFEVPRSVLDEQDAELWIDRGTLNPDDVVVISFSPDELRPSATVDVEETHRLGLEEGP